jgi:hypothetical protein
MFHPLAEYLREQGWERWSVAQVETKLLIWLIFTPGDSTPRIVGKLPRTALDVAICRREAAALCKLAGVADALGIPKLLLSCDLPGGKFLFVQSGVPGLPVPDRIPLSDVIPWLENFQNGLGCEGTVAETAAEVASICHRQVDLTPEERRLLDLAISSQELGRVAACAAHGDFWAGNIYSRNGRFYVFDWSNFHYGSPVEDVYNFIADQGYRGQSGVEAGMESLWRVFFGSTMQPAPGEIITRSILAARGIDSHAIGPLFLVFLATRLARVEFSTHAAWRLFIRRFLEAGAPTPFEIRDTQARA